VYKVVFFDKKVKKYLWESIKKVEKISLLFLQIGDLVYY